MLGFGFWSPAWYIGVLVCPHQTAPKYIYIVYKLVAVVVSEEIVFWGVCINCVLYYACV